MRYAALLLTLSLAVVAASRKPVIRRLQCEAITAAGIAARDKEWAEARKQAAAATRLLHRDDRGFELYSTPNGQFWLPGGDANADILQTLIAEQSLNWYGDGDQMVRRGDIVIDCGAHVGVFTRVALDLGAARVIAIEPAPENLECLRRTFDSEIAEGRVQIIPMGAWDTDTNLPLFVAPRNSTLDSFVNRRDGDAALNGVRLISLDHLADIIELDHVDLIKLNVSGAESRVLKGAYHLLQSKPRVSVSVDHLADLGALAARLLTEANAGYTLECSRWRVAQGAVRPGILWFR